jgi:hypothetical protein
MVTLEPFGTESQLIIVLMKESKHLQMIFELHPVSIW